MFIPVLLWQPLRNVAATLSAQCPADALEVSMATIWHHVTVKDNQSQSMGQCWGMKKKDTDQITNYASCHFYSCFAKNVCTCVLCLLVFFVYHGLTVYASLWWLLSVYRMDRMGRTWLPFSFLQHWLTFNNNVAITLQSKSFKRNLMWNSIFKYYLYGSFIEFFLKLYFLQETLD